MTFLTAVTGLSGVGKTTAIGHFESLGLGQRVYLGEEVLKEVNLRGLARNPENERSVRLTIREDEGPAVRATPLIERILAMGTNVFVDAIFDLEEYQHLKESFAKCSFVLLGVRAKRETRAVRLAIRPERPLTFEELQIRDSTELTQLRTDKVMDQADHKIDNEDSLAAFQQALEQFWQTAMS
jgi:dephospho-CoA kinase